MLLTNKKCYLITCLLVLFTTQAFAQNDKRGWELNLKRAALDLSSTDVKNAEDYKNFSNAQLTADSEHVIKGHLDTEGNYFAPHFVWGNELFMEYGKTTLKPYNDKKTTNEKADIILFTSSYTQRLWKVENFLGGFEAGPFGALSYETEFNSQSDSPLKKVLRATGGVKVFEGKYVKDLHLAGFAERDFTYDPNATKFGWEAGFEINQPIREGVNAVYKGLFRDYVYTSHRVSTDLDYELSIEARFDVAVLKELSISPIIKYYTAQGHYVAKRGENLFVGVSLSFSHLFIKADQI